MRIALLILMFSLFLISPAQAQVSMSPRGSVSQTLDQTTITVDYSRPRLRGREGLFGGQIWWGHIWTPGADYATTFEFDNDIVIQDVPVPAGKYSVWMIHEKGDWEVWLDPNSRQFHLPEPPRPDNGYFFWVKPDTTAPVEETLTFDFTRLDNFATNLQLRWDNRLVNMEIKVPPSFSLEVTEEQAAPYIGTYSAEFFQNVWVREGFTFDMPIKFSDGKMAAEIKWEPDGDVNDQRLLVKTDQIFYWAFFEGEELMSTADFFFEFDVDESGQATAFEMRTFDDEIWMRGTRK